MDWGVELAELGSSWLLEQEKFFEVVARLALFCCWLLFWLVLAMLAPFLIWPC